MMWKERVSTHRTNGAVINSEDSKTCSHTLITEKHH